MVGHMLDHALLAGRAVPLARLADAEEAPPPPDPKGRVEEAGNEAGGGRDGACPIFTGFGGGGSRPPSRPKNAMDRYSTK